MKFFNTARNDIFKNANGHGKNYNHAPVLVSVQKHSDIFGSMEEVARAIEDRLKTEACYVAVNECEDLPSSKMMAMRLMANSF